MAKVQMQTLAATAARRAAYDAMLERVLPAVTMARSIGCTTGTHLAEFLEAVSIPALYGNKWSVRAANRVTRQLIVRGLLKWDHRHRGRRNPNLEVRRVARFTKAVETCHAVYAATTRPICNQLHRTPDSVTTTNDEAVHKQPVAVLA